MVPKANISFIARVLQAFKKIDREISIETLEHDFSPRFVKYFVEGVLGYAGSEYEFERGRTDITLYDENRNRVAVIETKRPKETLDTDKWQDQAGKYADSSTRFVGLTNGYRFLLWEITRQDRNLRADIDFKALLDSKKTNEAKLSTRETEQILFLDNLTKQQIWSESKYAKFNDYYGTIDISDEAGFAKLIEQLNYISNDLMRQYTYAAFDEYYAEYAKYRRTKSEIEEIEKFSNMKNAKQAADIASLVFKTEGKYKKYLTFWGYYYWKAISNRPDDKEEENKQIFCKESIYVLLNRLLFIRICEDKKLLKNRISNGGIERLRAELEEPILGNEVFKQIVLASYEPAKKVYYHFYEKDNPLDWYQSGDGRLDRVLNRVLWILNQFNFTKVDRDILGKLYEKFLPKEERKKLGEFYTPDEVVDYILDAVDYIPSKAIEEKDLMDPACGSGGFLVRAARRLIARHVVKFGKATPKEALDNKRWAEVYERLTPKECEEIVNSVAMHIHGFDINPFAVSISEMNLLFQVIDLYSKAVIGNESFRVPRFKIYQTDSLEMPSEQTNLAQFYVESGISSAKDKDAVDELKRKGYDFVVGNPPWLGILKISKLTLASYSHFISAKGKFDLYVLFIELGVKMLNKKGKLGYITQNRFLKVGYAKTLRDYLANNIALMQITDFGDIKVFSDATNYPCVLIFQNDSPASFTHIEFKDKAKELSPEELLLMVRKQREQTKYDDKYFMLNTIKQDTLTNAGWHISSFDKKPFIRKLEGLNKLKDFTEVIMQGITCGGKGSDDIYYTNAKTIELFKIEEALLKKVIRGKNIRRYCASLCAEQVLFPYEANGRPIDLRLYPGAARYLNQFKEKLEGRVLDGKIIREWNKEWFELWRARKPQFFDRQKIVGPRIAEQNRFALDETGAFLADSAIAIIFKKQNVHFILALLNSKLLGAYISVISPYVQGKYYNYSKSYIEKLPIKLPTNKKEAAIEGKIITEVKEILKLKKKDENAATAKLEDQIDDLVFELYGITPEERKVIEKAVERNEGESKGINDEE
jgi:hypothetical protein